MNTVEQTAAYLALEQALDALVAKGDARRLSRTNTVPVLKFVVLPQENVLLGVVQNSMGTGTYNCRVAVLPRRSFHCTCQDFERHARASGAPCKHVLALARSAKPVLTENIRLLADRLF